MIHYIEMRASCYVCAIIDLDASKFYFETKLHLPMNCNEKMYQFYLFIYLF